MKEDNPTSSYNQPAVLAGMTGNGKFRSVLVAGPSSQEKSRRLAELGTAIVRTEPTTFCAFIDSRKTKNPYEWCSQFARSLRTLKGAEPMALAKFAMSVGKSLIPFMPGGKNSSPEEEAAKHVVSCLTQHFEDLTSQLPKGKNSPKLVIILDKFDTLGEPMLNWLSTTLNDAFRNSSSFQPSRFIFSANEKSQRLKDFFDRFGFENVHEFRLGAPAANEPALASPEAFEAAASSLGVGINEPSQVSKETNELKNKPQSPSVSIKEPILVEAQVKAAEDFFSSYNDLQRQHIILASYPSRVSRYSLEFFTDSRNAALAYNWLKREPKLCQQGVVGDLVLDSVVKEHARVLHAKTNEKKAESFSVLASVLDAFFQLFPDSSFHWVPVNLQLFSWFNDRVLSRLFQDAELEGVREFLAGAENSLISNGDRVSLTNDAKLVTRRLIDLSHLEPASGLLEKARELWTLDLEKYGQKRSRIEGEKKNFSLDIQDTESEISNLSEVKESLVNNFRLPGKIKAERIFSFSSSKILILIGFVTVGLSLLSDYLGPYHAACGLALSLVGFFWPNVEIKKSGDASLAIANSPLSLDAQQRSLEHRITNLQNRLKVMKSNLSEVDAQIAKMGDGWDEPFVELEDSNEY